MIHEDWFERPYAPRVFRALVDAGYAHADEVDDTVTWAAAGSRLAITVDVAGRAPGALDETFRKILKQFPTCDVDVIFVGGDIEHQKFVRTLVPTFQGARLGLLQVKDDGTVWLHHAESTIKKALEGEFERVDAPDVDLARLQQQMNEGHSRAQERVTEAFAFQQTLKNAKPWLTIGLCGVLTLVFLLQLKYGVEDMSTLARMGALLGGKVQAGQVDRLLSYSMLHGGFQHLLMNAISLWSLGSFFERILGRGRFAMVYVLSGLAGGILSFYASSASIVVGASGSIFGLIGVSAALAMRPMGTIPDTLMAGFRRNAMVNLFIQGAASLQPNISLAAHAGGFLAGFLLVSSGIAHPKNSAPETRNSALQIPGLALLALLGICSAVSITRGRVWARDDISTWQQFTLSGTSLRVTAPRMQEVSNASAPGGRREWNVAEFMEDGFNAGLIFLPVPPETQDSELEQLAQGFVNGTEPIGHPTDVSSQGSPSRSMLGDARRIDQIFSSPKGAGFRNTILIRRDGVFSLQIVYSEKRAASARQNGDRILESINTP